MQSWRQPAVHTPWNRAVCSRMSTPLRNEVDSTKSELTNSRSEMEASKLKLTELMFSLEMEQRSRSEAEEERIRLKQEIQSRDTQLDHMSQQLILAEGELEETSDNVKRLRNDLDSYQQKYEACVNQISSLEADLTRQHEKLNLSHKQVFIYFCIYIVNYL